MTDPRDGTMYKTIIIGEQTWMAENLKWLPSLSGPAQGSTSDPYYYVYGYDGTDIEAAKQGNNFKIYGALYNVPAAIISCPEGWRLPSETDFQVLEELLGMSPSEITGGGSRTSGSVGKKLKSDSLWTDNGNGTNSVGFNMLPGGYRNLDSTYIDIGDSGGMWSSTDVYTQSAWARVFNNNSDGVERIGSNKSAGTTIRCIKDE